MPSKMSTHGLGRGPSQSLIDAGAVGGKWVASDPPATLPDKFIKVWRWVYLPDSLNHFLGNGNPEGSAKVWWDKQWEHTKFVPKKPNTYISGPNENRCETPAEAEYNNRFWLEWMRLCEAAGYKAAIFSFGTGRPPHPVWDTAQQGNVIWEKLKPALRHAKANGHVVDLHAYHESVDEGNMLRHQSVWAWLPSDCRPFIVIGEWGLDGALGRFNDDLFKNQVPDPNGYYLNLIRDFDRRMQADPYVLLVTLFTEGTNNDERTWGPFNIEGKPIVGMLRDYIASQVGVPAPVPVPPAPPPQEPPMTFPYKAKLTNGAKVRLSDNSETGEVLPLGAEITVYAELPDTGKGKRAVIDPPARNVWADVIAPLNVGALKMAWPVKGVMKKVGQEFGVNPNAYKPFGLPGHEGRDFYAPAGADIVAMAGGVVKYVNRQDRDYQAGVPYTATSGHPYGHHVWVEHRVGADVYHSIYAHLKDVVVAVGQPVGTGDLLGHADDSGNSFGSHLHATLKKVGATATGYRDSEGRAWPRDIIDMRPYMEL